MVLSRKTQATILRAIQTKKWLFKLARAYLVFGFSATIWLRLREKGLTLAAVDKDIMESRPDWKPGQAKSKLLHPYRATLMDMSELALRCHGVIPEQVEDDIPGFYKSFVPHIYLCDRWRRLRHQLQGASP